MPVCDFYTSGLLDRFPWQNGSISPSRNRCSYSFPLPFPYIIVGDRSPLRLRHSPVPTEPYFAPESPAVLSRAMLHRYVHRGRSPTRLPYELYSVHKSQRDFLGQFISFQRLQVADGTDKVGFDDSIIIRSPNQFRRVTVAASCSLLWRVRSSAYSDHILQGARQTCKSVYKPPVCEESIEFLCADLTVQ